MKTNQLLRFSFLLFGVFLCTVGTSESLEEKRKVIDKSYNVSERTALSISNSFGKVHLDTWDKPEVRVKVEIITRGRNEDRAQQLMDRISVKIAKSTSQIAFETVLGSSMSNKQDEAFEIHYTISAPPKNQIMISNKFGDTYIGKREGDTEVTVGYGNLKIEDVLGFLELELSFGNGSVGKTRNAEIVVKYSDLDIASGEMMKMEQKFSDVDLMEVQKLNLESKYGKVAIGKAGDVDTDAQFSGFSIDELTGSLYMEASYISDFKIGKLHKTFTRVEIHGKFSAYEIHLEEGVKANLEAEFSFAGFKSSYRDLDLYYQVKDGNRSEYKGRIGGGDPDRKIIVSSSYGDLRLR